MFHLFLWVFIANVFLNASTLESKIMAISTPCITLQKQRLRNSFLRTLLYSSYKGWKQQLLSLQKDTKEKIHQTYQSLLTNFYMTSYHYYSIDENDAFFIENILQLLL